MQLIITSVQAIFVVDTMVTYYYENYLNRSYRIDISQFLVLSSSMRRHCIFRLGGIHKLRLQDLGFFWPPTPLRLHFIWYKSLQKVNFFDHLPPSSCKRSLWTPPYTKHVLPHSNTSSWVVLPDLMIFEKRQIFWNMPVVPACWKPSTMCKVAS